MKLYLVKSAVITIIISLSAAIADIYMKLDLPAISYAGVVYLGALFSLVRYFTHHDQNITENQKIRRLMIGSMLRLFLVLIFLVISLFNMKPLEMSFVVIFGLTFIFFLFFDILEMRTNLRPDSEKPNENAID